MYFLPQNIGDEFDVLFNCENDVISDFKNNSYPAIIVKTQALKKMGRTFPDYHIQLLTNVAFFIKKMMHYYDALLYTLFTLSCIIVLYVVYLMLHNFCLSAVE